MSKYMSQIPPEPKPTAGPRKIKPQPAKGPRKPRTKMDKDLRDKREMPKRIGDGSKIPKPAYGMSSTPEQRKMARMQMTNDMKKRGMLRKKQG